ncbi:MAG: hypothetical protein GXP51_03105 [Deltaproteobacteria bacterium]|nr:hypothetical protein [Deltaproteobacteria bacterium]
MTLRIKIMLILVITVIIAVGGTGLFFLHHFERAFHDSVVDKIGTLGKQRARIVADYIQMQKLIATHIGNQLPKEALELRDGLWIEDYLAGYGEDFAMFDNGFFILDADGILRADYPPHPELYGRDFSFRPYFKRTMQSRQPIVARPYRSARTGKEVLTFTVYLTSRDGTPLGLLGCSSQLLENIKFSRILTEKLGTTGYSYIFDKSRLMILHPDSGRLLTRDVPVGANKMFDAAIKGFEGTTETVNSKGIPMLAAFYGVEGTDWIVASQQPLAEAMMPLVTAKRPLVLMLFVGCFVAALVGMLLVHRSLADLLVLERVTADLAIPEEGDADIEQTLTRETQKLVLLTGHPEFGPLAGTIRDLYRGLGRALSQTRQMADELDDAYQQLKTTQQILQQEKMASIGQLAAGVAHEINNPMGFINSNLNSLGRYFEKMGLYLGQLENQVEQAGDEQLTAELTKLKRQYKIQYLLEDIPDLISESSSGADRVREIVQNLKSFSRVDQSQRSEVNINDCLESTIAIAWNEIKYKATLERNFAELPLLDCYPQQLNQVFLNILVNAAQAIENKGVIRLKTWAEQGVIKVAISDDGCGIPAEIQERIFEPFFTTKEVGKGTGLGMSISYDIVKKHHGEILLVSEEGQGTTFTIELPYGGEEQENG